MHRIETTHQTGQILRRIQIDRALRPIDHFDSVAFFRDQVSRTLIALQIFQLGKPIRSEHHRGAEDPVISGRDDPIRLPVHPIQKIHSHQAVTPVESHDANPAFAQSQNANGFPDEPVIQIAIPADEMFPPGAVPEGMHFAADLMIAADGSAERLRLRPRFAGFERRTTQP